VDSGTTLLWTGDVPGDSFIHFTIEVIGHTIYMVRMFTGVNNEALILIEIIKAHAARHNWSE